MSFHKELQPEESDLDSSNTIPTAINDIDEEGYVVLSIHARSQT